MNNKPKVSIVVPIYNKEQILHKCLDSLVNQTMQDIEVILINDGSTDNSEAVCLDYVEKYPNLVHYHAFENGGVSKARNRGIDLAIGEYIGFVDSDDWVALDFCEKMYDADATDEGVSMVVCGINMLKHSKITHTHNSFFEDKQKFISNDQILRNSPANKIFRTSVIKKYGINFPERSHNFEDLAFLFKFFAVSKNYVIVKRCLYFYNQNDNSITYTSNANIEHLSELYITINTTYDFLFSNRLLNSNNALFCNIFIDNLLIVSSLMIIRFLRINNKNIECCWVNFFTHARKYKHFLSVVSYVYFIKNIIMLIPFFFAPSLVRKFKKINLGSYEKL